MSHAAITWSWTVRGLDPSTRLVLLALADRTNKDTCECNPAHRTIADDTEISVSTVRRSIKKLIGLGIVVVSERKRKDGVGQTSNQYFLAVHIEGREPSGKRHFEGLTPPSQNEHGAAHNSEHPPLFNREHPKNRMEGTSESKDSSESPPGDPEELDLGLPPVPPKDPTVDDLAVHISEEWGARAFATPLRGQMPTEAAVEKAMKLAKAYIVGGQSVIDVWNELFKNIDQSDFLQGRVAGRDGRPPFKLTLSFLLEKRNFEKTLEGRFGGKSTGEQRRGSTSEATGRFLNRIRSGQGRSTGGRDSQRAVARR